MISVAKTRLALSGVSVDTPSGRPLFRDLHLSIADEQVAVIGRNGVGKSTLLEVLAQRQRPGHGRVRSHGTTILVKQLLDAEATREALRSLHPYQDASVPQSLADALYTLQLGEYHELLHAKGWSRGEQRKIALLSAWHQQPDMLLLDEPTEALDVAGQRWLFAVIQQWQKGLIVVSHDRSLLRLFQHFLILGESGGRYFQGTLADLEADLEAANAAKEKKYKQQLQVLEDKEWHHARVSRRRARKKRLGRIHEIGRAPSKAMLNTKRGHAQVSQGHAAKIRKQRHEGARAWTKSTRRALDAKLALHVAIPTLPPATPESLIVLDQISYQVDGQALFSDLSLQMGRERIGIIGPNGSGKTTLLKILMGECQPTSGKARRQDLKIGYIAQHAANWMLEESLVTLLGTAQGCTSLDQVAAILVAHKFPLSLAQRSLDSLSPGERLRAALICLLTRTPAIECLVLDEPTCSLDFLGFGAFLACLQAWPGGLVVASHDQEFLEAIGLQEVVTLGWS